MKQCLQTLLFLLILQMHLGANPNPASKDSIPRKTIADIPPLKVNLSADGKQYFQFTFLNQVWFRYNESNPGTTVEGKNAPQTLDVGLRRTRIQMFGAITERVFLYFQFGQNNFNSQYNIGGNRKNAAFFHDALCEYNALPNNQLKIGGGLTITNGLSRFSQPSIGTIMTMDVPVFAQATVDQTDEFSRKLSIYARGQFGKLDYRFSFSDPFPIQSNGSTPPSLGSNATFAQIGRSKQYQGLVFYQFYEKEPHTTPYMTGTFLGKKKVFNLGGGLIYQKNAMWHAGNSAKDTIYQPLLLWNAEAFIDLPVNKEKGTAFSGYAGFFKYDFGKNYLRFNGIMNPANGHNGPAPIAANNYGNAFPMFGTGNSVYLQAGYLLGSDVLGTHGTLMPYASAMLAAYKRLEGNKMNVFHLGCNWLMAGHKAKLTLDYENRPTFKTDANSAIEKGPRKGSFVLQYQIFI